MLVFLPQKTDGIGAMEGRLTAANLADWTKGLMSEEVTVYLPRFKATCEFRLDKALAALGMSDAFDSDKADFTGMGGRKGDLYISAVVHKAFVEVNEEGTEAAAATAVVMRPTAVRMSPQPVFRADHPFVFLIRDNRSGSVLFLGRVTDPTR
jgi:serpin B